MQMPAKEYFSHRRCWSRPLNSPCFVSFLCLLFTGALRICSYRRRCCCLLKGTDVFPDLFEASSSNVWRFSVLNNITPNKLCGQKRRRKKKRNWVTRSSLIELSFVSAIFFFSPSSLASLPPLLFSFSVAYKTLSVAETMFLLIPQIRENSLDSAFFFLISWFISL